mmetsp:Transcript_142112/g.317971  ORF Transcript_142112/g.317971 Transcript_142112/m.317971 type:complete len:241 (-) Transcript_142112:24-746(-)
MGVVVFGAGDPGPVALAMDACQQPASAPAHMSSSRRGLDLRQARCGAALAPGGRGGRGRRAQRGPRPCARHHGPRPGCHAWAGAGAGGGAGRRRLVPTARVLVRGEAVPGKPPGWYRRCSVQEGVEAEVVAGACICLNCSALATASSHWKWSLACSRPPAGAALLVASCWGCSRPPAGAAGGLLLGLCCSRPPTGAVLLEAYIAGISEFPLEVESGLHRRPSPPEFGSFAVFVVLATGVR